MSDKVLLPLEGAGADEGRLRYVCRWAQNLNAPVVVMSVLKPAPPAQLIQTQREVDRRLQAVVTQLGQEGVQATAEVVVGRPAVEIVRMAERQGCHVIVLATPGRGSRGPGHLDRVAEKVLHTSPIPVLALPPQPFAPSGAGAGPVATVLVPLDGSPLAETALPAAEELAHTCGASVALVHAAPRRGGYVAAVSDGAYTDAIAAEVSDAEIVTYLAAMADKLQAEGVDVRWRLLYGPPADGIVALAQQMPQSLIALTARGHSALARWFLGNVTAGVVRRADTPVLVIPQYYSQQYAVRLADLLAKTPLFAALTPQALTRLAEAARIHTYQPGEVIVREGDRAAGCFILLSGMVEVTKGGDAATAVVLARLGAGEIVGEMAMLDEHPRSATVRALEAAECVALRRADFLAELQRHPALARGLLPVLVRRLREARARPPS